METNEPLVTFRTPLTLPNDTLGDQTLALIVESRLQRVVLESNNPEWVLTTRYVLQDGSALPSILETRLFVELHIFDHAPGQRWVSPILDTSVEAPLYGPQMLAALASATKLANAQAPHLHALLTECNRDRSTYGDLMGDCLSRARNLLAAPEGQTREHGEREYLTLLLALGTEALWDTRTLAEECQQVFNALTQKINDG